MHTALRHPLGEKGSLFCELVARLVPVEDAMEIAMRWQPKAKVQSLDNEVLKNYMPGFMPYNQMNSDIARYYNEAAFRGVAY